MHLFYASDIVSDYYTLTGEEARHCLKVLRLKKNDTVNLTDGKGNLHTALVDDINQKECNLTILSRSYEEKSDPIIHIAVSPTKSIERFEWFLEKATEIGIDIVTPLICERTERLFQKPERWNKILISALKQSFRTWLPELREAVRFEKMIASAEEQSKLIAVCEGSSRKMIKESYIKGLDAVILIGPEGDFTKDEVEKAKESGFAALTLGKSRLRTETAALVACHTLNLLNE
jgi:16S rRNA (uracil1498-N3)-methyltransferase